MPRQFTPKVITANTLLGGEVVWFTTHDTWANDITHAELLTQEDYAADRLRIAQQDQADVVGPYLADAVAGTDGPSPVHFREVFRTRGPSNYQHGPQEGKKHV